MKFINHIFLFIIAISGTSCNSDIFLDKPDIPDVQNITIEGDGGEDSFIISTKHLEHFGFDLMSSSQKYCTYYNKNGYIVGSNAPASDISKIVFATNFVKLELLRDNSQFIIRSICNASKYEHNWDIRLEYSYGVRFIEVKVLPGKPIELVEVIYNDDMITTDRAKVTNFRYKFTNNGPIPQYFTVQPYLNELASILVEPETYESWTKGERFNMPVPVYSNGEWKFLEKDGIMPGDKFSFEGPDRFTKVQIDVPAYTSVNVLTDVIYSGARITGKMIFRNDILDFTFFENIKVTSLYPIGHEIRVENEK